MLQKHSPTRATALQQGVQYASRLSHFYQFFVAQERWRCLWRRSSEKHMLRKALKSIANLLRPVSECRLLRDSATISWHVIPVPWRLSRTCCISRPRTSPAENPPTATKQKQKRNKETQHTHTQSPAPQTRGKGLNNYSN